MMKFLIRTCTPFLYTVSLLRFNRHVAGRQMEDLYKIFVRHVKDEDVMKISFVYGNSSFPEREFNFMRSKEEKLESALYRIKFKIEDAISQRFEGKKKKPNRDTDVTEDKLSLGDIKMIRSGKVLDGHTQNMDVWIEGTQLKIGEFVYEISENPPVVSYLGLPKNIMAGFPVYPKICLEFSSKEDSVFTWYRSMKKEERQVYDSKDDLIVNKKGEYWLQIGNGFFYVTTQSDIGHKLRIVCFPKYGTRSGKTEETISTNVVVAGPQKCPFEERHAFTKNLSESGSIRCVSYNILADLYADSDTARNELFPYCPKEALTLDYRKQLYLKEILGYNGDILCLQEVDRKVFLSDLVPVLSSTGLEGVFNEKGGQVAEGLACFFRSSKFKVNHSEAIILSEMVETEPILQSMWSKISENEKLKLRILSRTTALQIVVLECLDEPNKRILLGNTHLYFHPESDNIRLIQASLCVRYLEHFLKMYKEKDPTFTTAVMLSGDFNSCPEFGVLKLMTEGFVPEDCADWNSNPEEAVPGMALKNTLPLGSACGTPCYTNYTQAFNGCLDYIFYDKECFTVTEIVPFPTHEQVTEHVALPNEVFPSDHLALVCKLKWN